MMHACMDNNKRVLFEHVSQIFMEPNPTASLLPPPQPPTTISLAMVTHVVHIRVHKLSTSPARTLVLETHVRRHVESALAHVLAISLHLVNVRLDPPLVTFLGHLPSLPVELDLHLVHPVVARARREADLVVLRISGCVLGVGCERAIVTGSQPSNARVWAGLFWPPALPSPSAPLRMHLVRLFLIRSLELLACEFPVHDPIVVVAFDVRLGAQVSFKLFFGYTQVVRDEGGVGVEVVVFVLEDVRLSVFPFFFGANGRMTVA